MIALEVEEDVVKGGLGQSCQSVPGVDGFLELEVRFPTLLAGLLNACLLADPERRDLPRGDPGDVAEMVVAAAAALFYARKEQGNLKAREKALYIHAYGNRFPAIYSAGFLCDSMRGINFVSTDIGLGMELFTTHED